MAKTLDDDILKVDGALAAQAMAICAQAQINLIRWGDPGIGKTASAYAMAKALGVHIEVIIGSLRAPEDFLGMPVVNDVRVPVRGTDGELSYVMKRRVNYVPPSFVYNLQEAVVRDGWAIGFVDEISTSPPSVQAAMLRMVQEGVVGDEVLDGVSWIAAANPPEIAAGGWELAAPLANRFVHLRERLNVSATVHGMQHGFAESDIPRLPKQWFDKSNPYQRTLVKEQSDLIGGYLIANQAAAHDMPMDAAAAGFAWPSPRSWYGLAARVLAACKAAGASSELTNTLVCGAVGAHHGTPMLMWRDKLDLPNPEDVIAGRVKIKWEPSRGDKMYVILNSLVSAFRNNQSRERWDALWKIYDWCMTQTGGGVEFVAAAAQELAKLGRAHEPRMPLPLKEMGRLIPTLKQAGMMLE